MPLTQTILDWSLWFAFKTKQHDHPHFSFMYMYVRPFKINSVTLYLHYEKLIIIKKKQQTQKVVTVRHAVYHGRIQCRFTPCRNRPWVTVVWDHGIAKLNKGCLRHGCCLPLWCKDQRRGAPPLQEPATDRKVRDFSPAGNDTIGDCWLETK